MIVLIGTNKDSGKVWTPLPGSTIDAPSVTGLSLPPENKNEFWPFVHSIGR